MTEIQRALGIDDQVPEYGDETIIRLEDGGSIRCPASPNECIYVRICNAQGQEIAYWHSDEWQRDPTVVMGAILGTARTAYSELILTPHNPT